MTDSGYSPLAARVAGVRDPKLAALRKAFGYCVHTTGGGVTDLAQKTKRDPLDVAIEIYIASQNGSNGYKWGGPHYVCDFDGGLHQIAPDHAKTAHCGGRSGKYPTGTRQHYLDGSWTRLIPSRVVDEWRKQWPTRKHPYSLFPSADPNTDYVGIECIPIGDGFGGEPMAPGLRFTTKQHNAVIALGRDLAQRHGWPPAWFGTGRLVGHEDVDILNRSNTQGGWDPGWLRPSPYFDFEYVRAGMA